MVSICYKSVLGNRMLLTLTWLLHVLSFLNLSLLDCRCVKITRTGLKILRGLPLERLNLKGLVRLTDGAMIEVAAMSNLVELCLCDCTGLTIAGLVHLQGLPALATLDITR